MTKKKVKEPPEPTYAASWHCFWCGKDSLLPEPITRAEAMEMRSLVDDGIPWCSRCKKAMLWLVVDYPPEPTRRNQHERQS